MGIMTGNAGESSVWFAPTLAVFEAVRRKAEVQFAQLNVRARRNFSPGAVARAAEIHRLDRIQAARIHDQVRALLLLSRFHGGYMTGARSVTAFASHTWHRGIDIQLVVGHRSGGVTGKTCAALGRRHVTSRGLFKVAGHSQRLSRSDVQTLRRGIKTQMAFVETAVSLVDISLTHV